MGSYIYDIHRGWGGLKISLLFADSVVLKQ